LWQVAPIAALRHKARVLLPAGTIATTSVAMVDINLRTMAVR
jgi:hypothetical protein